MTTKKMTEQERAREDLKYEIAEELGLMGKVRETGWKSLTARESGRVGGILARREKEKRLATTPNPQSQEQDKPL